VTTSGVGTTSDVLILGGGPVGCLLAVLLRDAGVDVVLVERDLEPYSLPRAIVMDDEIQRIFHLHGMGEFLLERADRLERADFVDNAGNVVIGVDILEAGLMGVRPVVAHYQPELDAMLRREVVSRGADARWGRTVTEMVDRGDRVETTLNDGSVVVSRWFVGCDGASSWTRRHVGLTLEDLQFDQPWLVVDIELHEDSDADLPLGVRQYCETARPVTYVKGVRRFRRWEFQIQPGEDPEQLNTGDSLWSLLSRWVTPADARLVRSANYRFHAVVAPQMRAGNVFLAGDSAHQTPPFAGQGLNSGMRDAVNLAWKLGWVVAGHAGGRSGGDALLDTYTTERVPHVRRSVRSAVDMGKLIDQIAGHESHGVGVDAGYGGDTDSPYLEAGLVVHGDPRAGRQFWHHPEVERLATDGAGRFVLVVRSEVVQVPESLSRWPVSRVVDPQATTGSLAVLVRPDLYVAGVAGDEPSLSELAGTLVTSLR